MDLKVFRQGPSGKVFDGTFSTDGFGVSVLKRSPNGHKGAGRKRKVEEKQKVSDIRLIRVWGLAAGRH